MIGVDNLLFKRLNSKCKEQTNKRKEQKAMSDVAVLSSTVINVSGEYKVEVNVPLPDIKGLPSYVGHPDTLKLLAALGADYQGAGVLFQGLAVGESFIAVPLANPNRDAGFTVDQALSGLDQIRVTRVTRIA